MSDRAQPSKHSWYEMLRAGLEQHADPKLLVSVLEAEQGGLPPV